MKSIRSAVGVPEQAALQAVLASFPELGELAGKLRAASAAYESIRTKAFDRSFAAAAEATEQETRATLVSKEALAEIGRASVEEVAAARQAHREAQEKLAKAPGRQEALTAELRKVQDELNALLGQVDAVVNEWVTQAKVSALQLATAGVELIVEAAQSLSDLGLAGLPPRSHSDVAHWLEMYNVNWSSTFGAKVSSDALDVLQLTRRARQQADVDHAPIPERGVPEYTPQQPLSRNPGHNAQLALNGAPYDDPRGEGRDVGGHTWYHDDDLAEEPAESSTPSKRIRSAPYSDGREGAEEVR